MRRPSTRRWPSRGIDARWVCWDDPAVDWAAADLVAVRSTWDYIERHEEFVAWARRVDGVGRLLNGADVFAWNVDKAYLTGPVGDLPVVPDPHRRDARPSSPPVSREFGTAVVKPRVGAGGAGVLVVDDPADPRLGTEVDDHPELHNGTGPVGRAAARRVGADRGRDLGVRARRPGRSPRSTSCRPVARSGCTSTSEAPPGRCRCATRRRTSRCAGMAAAERVLGRPLDYGRVDMMRLADGTLAVSELELTEPGLYLDVLPENARPFADLVAGPARLTESTAAELVCTRPPRVLNMTLALLA